MATEKLTLKLDGKYTGKKAFNAAEKDMDGLKRKADKLDKSLSKGSAATSNKFKQLGGSLGVFNKGLGQSVSKLGATTGALGGLTAMLGGPLVAAAAAAAAAIGTFAVMSYQKAVQSQAEWAKFKGVVESAGQSFENSKKIVKDFAYTSGTAVGEVRTAFSQLTAAGINPSGEALRGVKEMAIGLRTDMTSAATAYTRIVKGGAGAGRTLSKLGITMEEISTGGKVDTAKLQAILEQKFGGAADNFANTAEAAGIRLGAAIDGMMVAFGGILLPLGTALQNGLAWVIKGLTQFGGIVYNLFGGSGALLYAMQYLQPALDELASAIGDFAKEIFGDTQASGQLTPLITIAGALLSGFVRVISTSIRVTTMFIGAVKDAAKWISDAANYWNTQYKNSGAWIRGLGQRINSLIMDAANYLRGAWNNTANFFKSAGQRIYNAVANFPSWLWNAVTSALPKIRWPTSGEILDAIKRGLGFAGPNFSGGILRRWKANLTAEGLAAQRSAVVSTYQSSPAAQSAAAQARSAMGIFAGPNFDGLSLNYEYYRGSAKSPWAGDNCLSGNCVDMTRGILQYAAASGSRRLGIGMGTWDGSPHVWAMVDGKAYDPSRKALEGTWSPPAAGPGKSGGSVLIDMRGSTIYDGPKFEKAITNILNKHLG